MKLGDLVEHRDGTIGLVIEVDDCDDQDYPYRVWFFAERETCKWAEWFIPCVFEVVSENR